MLDPWVIEEILKREEAARREQEVRVEIPVHPWQPERVVTQVDPDRGVTTIDI